MKSTERHQMKEDGIAKGFFSVVDFLKNNTRMLARIGIAAAGVAVVILAVLFFMNRHEASQSKVASEILTAAENLEQNPGGLAALERLAGNGKFNRVAYIELAKYWAGKGDLVKAGGYLGKIPAGRKDGVYYQGELMKARLSVLRKDYDQAAAAFERIVNEKPKDFPLDYAMLSLAETYELKGDNAKALSLYREIASKYSQSSIGYQASLKANRLALAK